MKMLPSFFPQDCKVVQAWAEKRPCEEPPLVKIEMLNCGGAILPVRLFTILTAGIRL